MIVSPPSSEKRFWPTYFVCRNFSKSSALCTRRRILTFWGRVKAGWRRVDSMRSCSQSLQSWSWMWAYSTPTWPQ